MLLAAILVMGLLALVCGIALILAKKKFGIKEEDKENKEKDKENKIEKIRAILPGSNCGACGSAGCDAFARAVIDGKVPVNGCKIGGQEVAQKITDIIGAIETVEE